MDSCLFFPFYNIPRNSISDSSSDCKDYMDSVGYGSLNSCLPWCSCYMNQFYSKKDMWSLVGKNPKDTGLFEYIIVLK